jgi:membrane-associated protein
MQSILDAIRSLPVAAAYAIIGGLVFGEAAVFIGFVLPGETAVVLGGFLASIGHLDIAVLCLIVFVCAVVGDSIGYEVGKQFGPWVMGLRFLKRHQARLDKAQRMLKQRGGPAVLIGRFTAFFRAVMPGLAGLSGMPYRTFLIWNAIGGLGWGVGFCLVGYFAGQSYETVAKNIGRGSALVIAALVIGAIAWWHFRRKHQEESEEADWDSGPGEVSGTPETRS